MSKDIEANNKSLQSVLSGKPSKEVSARDLYHEAEVERLLKNRPRTNGKRVVNHVYFEHAPSAIIAIDGDTRRSTLLRKTLPYKVENVTQSRVGRSISRYIESRYFPSNIHDFVMQYNTLMDRANGGFHKINAAELGAMFRSGRIETQTGKNLAHRLKNIFFAALILNRSISSIVRPEISRPMLQPFRVVFDVESAYCKLEDEEPKEVVVFAESEGHVHAWAIAHLANQWSRQDWAVVMVDPEGYTQSNKGILAIEKISQRQARQKGVAVCF